MLIEAIRTVTVSTMRGTSSLEVHTQARKALARMHIQGKHLVDIGPLRLFHPHTSRVARVIGIEAIAIRRGASKAATRLHDTCAVFLVASARAFRVRSYSATAL